MLNDGQQAAKSKILEIINRSNPSKDDDDRYITFHGPAGTGKTFTFVDVVKSIDPTFTIGLTSPTHKAVKVMRQMAYNVGIDDRVDIRTIHSALGLSMKQVEGDEVLVRDQWAEEKVYDILFIDESSMLDDELLGYILDCQSTSIIFIGDKCQINPVNSNPGEISSVFTQVDEQVGLTQVMRQGEGNPIIDLATMLREIQNDIYAEWPPIQTNLLGDGAGVEVLPRMEWFKRAVSIFKSEDFLNDPDYCRCVAYTNDMVETINKTVRETIHGKDVAEFLVGEIIVAQGQGKLHKNAEECKILEINETIEEYTNIPCYEMLLSSLDNHSVYRVNILKDESRHIYNQKLERLANLANNLDRSNKRQHWRDFWAIKKTFDDFKHVYAMTAHKSQGSTFHHTFVYTPDFIRFGSTMEVKQLLYTATTRSSFRTTFAY